MTGCLVGVVLVLASISLRWLPAICFSLAGRLGSSLCSLAPGHQRRCHPDASSLPRAANSRGAFSPFTTNELKQALLALGVDRVQGIRRSELIWTLKQFPQDAAFDALGRVSGRINVGRPVFKKTARKLHTFSDPELRTTLNFLGLHGSRRWGRKRIIEELGRRGITARDVEECNKHNRVGAWDTFLFDSDANDESSVRHQSSQEPDDDGADPWLRAETFVKDFGDDDMDPWMQAEPAFDNCKRPGRRAWDGRPANSMTREGTDGESPDQVMARALREGWLPELLSPSQAALLLGLMPQGTPPDELRAAKAALVRKWHPDRRPQEEAEQAAAALRLAVAAGRVVRAV